MQLVHHDRHNGGDDHTSQGAEQLPEHQVGRGVARVQLERVEQRTLRVVKVEGGGGHSEPNQGTRPIKQGIDVYDVSSPRVN